MPSIGPEHPDYLELFYAGFGSGGSYPARLVKNPPDPDSELLEPQSEQEPASLSSERPEDLDLSKP
jgi:hypothetical protein